MIPIFVFVSFVFLKIAFELISREGITIWGAGVAAVAMAGIAVALQVHLERKVPAWITQQFEELGRPPKKLPFGFILWPCLVAIALGMAAGHLVIIGFSSDLAREIARDIEKGDLAAYLVLAAPLLAQSFVIGSAIAGVAKVTLRAQRKDR